MKRLRPASLRAKFLLTAFVGAVVPLALIGFWLTRTAERAGRQLLHDQLTRELAGVVERAENGWLHRRSDLLLLLESTEVRAALARRDGLAFGDTSVALRHLRAAFGNVQNEIEYIVYRDASNRPEWRLYADAAGVPRIVPLEHGTIVQPATASVLVHVPLLIDSNAAPMGSFEARVRLASLLPGATDYPARYGGALTVLDQRTGLSLLPTQFDSAQLARGELWSNRESWLSVRQSMTEPPISFVLAAPLDPFTRPFERAARKGAVALLGVALLACWLAVVLTKEVTGSLERLAVAADAVAHGNLERTVSTHGDDEVGRLGRAFNLMTESLRRTLRELSQRQALVAVGEFATLLAHEIRNPLTSIRLDLQVVQEKIPSDSRGHSPLARALKEIDRLNRAVNGGLKVARSGRIELERIDLREPLEVAVHATRPEFEVRNARLEPAAVGPAPIWIRGDAAALKQLFINLLVNAAQALEPGGRAGTRVEENDHQVTVSVWDHGPGIPKDKLKQIWEPFYSTKEEGTGLGLAISQRIVAAHGGEIEIDATLDKGTAFVVRLPLNRSQTAVQSESGW